LTFNNEAIINSIVIEANKVSKKSSGGSGGL